MRPSTRVMRSPHTQQGDGPPGERTAPLTPVPTGVTQTVLCRDATIRASTELGEVATPLKCKSWHCEECGPERQHQLQNRCIRANPHRFITITCRRGEAATPEDAAKKLADAWRTIVRRWRRLEAHHRCEYICIFEKHKSGWPHLHILWKGHWVSWKWLSNQTRELLNSPHVDIRRIDSTKQCVAYVAKYLSKSPERFGTCKRYWTSKGWPKHRDTDAPKVFPEQIKVAIVPKRLHEILSEWVREDRDIWHYKMKLFGWGELYDENTGEIFARPPDAEPYVPDNAFDAWEW